MFASSVRAQVEQLRELRYRQLAARLEGRPIQLEELEAAVDRLLMEVDEIRRGPSFYGSELVVRPTLPPVVGESQVALL